MVQDPARDAPPEAAAPRARDDAPSRSLAISAFIIAKNEADRIAAAIDSVRDLAAEVIVVDSGSDDGTPELAAALGARVFNRDWTGYGEQKRFGESRCVHDWILNLDADERLTPALAAEIRTLFAEGPPAKSGYVVAIADLYPHERAPSRHAYAYEQIRLYDRRKGRFSASPVHDTVRMAASELGRLGAPMHHRSVRSITHQVDKMNAYSTMQAREILSGGRRIGALRLMIEFPAAFFKAYVLRRHALRGVYGFVLSMNYAYGRFLRLAKVTEARLEDRMAGETADSNRVNES